MSKRGFRPASAKSDNKKVRPTPEQLREDVRAYRDAAVKGGREVTTAAAVMANQIFRETEISDADAQAAILIIAEEFGVELVLEVEGPNAGQFTAEVARKK